MEFDVSHKGINLHTGPSASCMHVRWGDEEYILVVAIVTLHLFLICVWDREAALGFCPWNHSCVQNGNSSFNAKARSVLLTPMGTLSHVLGVFE